jgi:Zn-dependent peptidase ImmA (M78 family)/transcriptional regulator with XRE-family HTH domain
MEKSTFGQRLKIVRSASGLSLRALAARIGNRVSAQMIGRYERGEAMPNSVVVLALAHALRVSENYLLDPEDLRLENVEFRRRSLTGRKEEAAVEAAVLDAVERYVAIEDLVGAASAAWLPPSGAPFRVRNVEQAEVAADRLRNLWNLGRDPIPNLAEFVEELGIKVIVRPLPEAFSGLLAHVRRRDGRLIPAIVVNTNHTGERQRLTMAHELGHLMLESDIGLDPEKAAFRFGSAFLMPAEPLWAEVGRHRRAIVIGELLELKSLFGVSAQAIAYRCRELDIIGEGTYRNLFHAFAQLGWRTPPYLEPSPLSPEQPRRFRRLCFRAVAEGLASDVRVAELLGISVCELDREMREPSAR